MNAKKLNYFSCKFNSFFFLLSSCECKKFTENTQLRDWTWASKCAMNKSINFHNKTIVNLFPNFHLMNACTDCYLHTMCLCVHLSQLLQFPSIKSVNKCLKINLRLPVCAHMKFAIWRDFTHLLPFYLMYCRRRWFLEIKLKQSLFHVHVKM